MSSIQERLQMKRVPLDKWSTKEKLCLASSVACSGDQNWMSVSRSLKMLCGTNRPNDWFAQKSCAAQYGKLLENVETPKRKKRTASERDGVAAVETPGESILRKLTQERIIELKKTIQEETQQYIKVKEDIILIQSGVTDEKKLREMWKQIEQEKAQKEKEQIQHAQWLKEREEKKLELERQWRPMYPNSPTATSKAPTPPIKFKEETDEDSQGSCKSGTSPLLTSLLKTTGEARIAGTSTGSSSTGTRTVSSATITNLLTGGVGSAAKPSSSSAITGSLSTTELDVDELGVMIKQEAIAASTSALDGKEQQMVKMEEIVDDESNVPDGSAAKAGTSAASKSDALFTEMDSEDNADPAKDLMDVLEDLNPADLDEILKENSGMILGDVDLKNVVDSIMEEDTLKDKDMDLMPDAEDASIVVVMEEFVGEPASKNEGPSVERPKSPPTIASSTTPTAAVAVPAEDTEPAKSVTTLPEARNERDGNDSVSDETTPVSEQATAGQPEKKGEPESQETNDAKVEIIPIEDSTSNSPLTNDPSSDDNKDTGESSGQEQPESVIVVSDSAKEEEEFEDREAEVSPTDRPSAMEDEDSDDKPLASLEVTSESGTVSQEKNAPKQEIDTTVAVSKPLTAVAEPEKRTNETVASPKKVKQEAVSKNVEPSATPTDEAKAKKEAMEKLASEYDFKDDEEPIVQMSTRKAKEEKHVSEDEVFVDAQETIEEPEEVKQQVEPPVKKPPTDDPVLTVTDTDDDSLIEMKIGKAKRDYSRRRLADEAQKLRDDLAGHSRSEETEGRSLRKLRDRDRSESPFVAQDDEPNEKMKRSYSSTPVMDSIPGSPASSEDRDYRAWKKSILAVYSKITSSKNATAFHKPLPEDQTAQLVYRPMDLPQIKRNIENGNIRTTAEFQRDILLMCTNAIMLNRPDLCSPNAASLLIRESSSIIETGMDPKAVKDRDNIFPLAASTESMLSQRHALHHQHAYHKGSTGTTKMKSHIKRILNIREENSTLDSYLLSLFNTENLNPTYVFLLPTEGKSKHVRKLIYQRSDFEEADFPNVTTINKFGGESNRTAAGMVGKPGSDMVLEKKIFEHATDRDTMDDGTRRVIEENVRTERNFIKFMDELNRDLEEEDQRRMLKESMRKSVSPSGTALFTPYTYKHTHTVGWDDLGLEGWAGGLRELHGHRFDPPVLEKPKTTKQPPQTMLQASFGGVQPVPSSHPTTSLGGATKTNALNQTAINVSAAARYKQTGVLLSEDIGLKLQEIYKRTNGSNARIKWPITNSRDAHRDEDVFIARANNPFGHSTKWRWSNETEQEDPLKVEVQPSRDGRAKRGVYNLYSMIKCATGCDPIIYKGYGCYCGFLGSGQALDGIDRCCKMHDYCYSTASCPMFLEYFVPYLWKCYRGRPLCAIDHGEWGGPGSCASRLCHCDLSLSKCLRRYYCPRKRNVCTTSPLRLLQNLVMVF
uniref:Bromo domain-containing protein n=1 Tax=Anopheles epiroticus TaxID=199890 RepID=A0A182PBA1_9DIPT